MFFRNIVKIILLFIVALLTAQARADTKFTVILDWFVNPNHAPIFVALEQGFFKKYNLDVNIITPGDPADPPKWIAMGKGDVALDYQPHLLMAMARGLPIRQVGTLIDHPLNCLVVLKSGPIKKLAELRGQQVAYSSPEIDLLILKTMLKTSHLTLEDIEPINVHYDLTQALLSKKVAAAIGMMRNFELVQLSLLGQEGRAFFPENFGVPLYSELVFIANQKKTLDDRYSRFFKALDEGRQYLIAHPNESWEKFAKQHQELNNKLNKEVWLHNINQFVASSQSVNTAQCEKLASFLSAELHVKVSSRFCYSASPSLRTSLRNPG